MSGKTESNSDNDFPDFSMIQENESVAKYLYLVRKCTKSVFQIGIESDDLIQEGTIGLLAAIRSYNSMYGVPFIKYAEYCIKSRQYSAVKSATNFKHFPLNSAKSIEELLENSDSAYSEIDELEKVVSSPEDILLAKESMEELYRVLKTVLSELEFLVFRLYLNGYSYSEISKHTGKSTKSVDNAIQRIRQKLARTKYWRYQHC